jgi:DNA repair photolyase
VLGLLIFLNKEGDTLSIIYEPTGKAREYAPLAINIYKGCTHGCRYCYGAKMPRTPADRYYEAADPKRDAIKNIKCDAKKLNGDNREILLSFTGDVYQPVEMELGLTRQAIEVLIEYNLPFTILTKGGTRVTRDFDLLAHYNKARFGTTLVFTSQADADKWEPHAPPIKDRIDAIEQAYVASIPTWVSLEPVIDPKQALGLIRALNPIVGHWKVGKLNYENVPVDWVAFREEVTGLLDSLGADYYIKKSLKGLQGSNGA